MFLLLLLAGILAAAGPAGAADPKTGPQTFRTQVVDASDRSSWPAGDWIPIDAARWEHFEAAGGTPEDREADVYIESARYTATLEGDALAEGRLEASIRNVAGHAKFLDLGRPSLAISEATMNQAPATWGADPQGSVRLHVPAATSTLSARWSLRGRAVLDRLVFDVTLVTAMSSRLELTLPADQILQADAGIVESEAVDEASGTRLWRVELGRRNRCRLMIRNGLPAATDGPEAIFADVSAVYSVRPDGLHIQTDFVYSTTDDAPFTTSFRVPWRFELRSVAYADSRGETALPYQRNLGRSLVAVSIAGSPAGRRATLRVRGVLPLRWDTRRRIALPRIELQDVVEMSRRLTLKIERPMELSAIDTQGHRQVGYAADDRSETWNLEELQANAPISVSVGLPNSVLSARSIGRVDLTGGVPTMQTILRFEAASGSTFTARCAIPDGWNVTRVEPLKGSATSALASWDVSEDSTSGPRVLRVEFQQGLTPQSVRELLVSARLADIPIAGRDVPMPAIVPLNVIDNDVYVVMRSEADQVPQLPAESGYVAVDRSELPESVGKAVREMVGSEIAADWIVLRARNPGADETLLLRTSDAVPDDPNRIEGLPAAESEENGTTSPAPSTTDQGPSVSVRIDSWLAPGGERQHRHAVYYRFPAKSRDVAKTLKIPRDVRIETLEINDRDVVPFVLDGTLQLPARPRSIRSVRIVFRTSGHFGFLQQTDRLQLPQWDLDVVEYEWQIHLPPGRRFAGLDEDRWIVAQPPSLTWLQRLLGPLAQSPQGASAPLPSAQQSMPGSATGNVLPTSVGGELVVVTGPEFGESAVISTWNPPRVASLSVVVLLATLTFLTLLRLQSLRLPPTAVTVWWSIVLGGALLAPDCYAPLFGAACSGTLLALLLPRRLVSRFDLFAALKRPEADAQRSTPRSSAVTASVGGLLVWLTLGQGWAQEPSAERVSVDAAATDGSDATSVDVLIPEQAGDNREVYVREALLHRIEAWERELVPRYLIRSAEYAVLPSDRDTIDLSIRYDVLLSEEVGPVRVVLPLQGVTFASADSCRVNGEPANVIPSSDGRGVVVEVVPGSSDTATTDDGDAPRVLASATIDLRCRGRVQQARSGRRFRAAIPSVTNTQVLVEKVPEDGSRHWVSGNGLIRELGHSLEVELGPAEELSVSWETSAQPGTDSSGLQASILSMVEVGTQRLRLRYNMTLSSEATDEPPSTATLHLPPRMFVESVRGETLLATYSAPAASGGTDVRLEFSEPLTEPTRLALDLVMPTETRSSLVTIPALQLLDDATTGRHIVGVIAPPGLRVAASNDAAATATSTLIPTGDVGDLWVEAAEWPVPEVAFDVRNPGTLIVKLTPLQTERAASIQQTVVVQREQLLWSAVIELEVASLPTFLHRFDLDPRVRLESVSVEQDGAERLRRSVREARRLTLFLNSDRLGTQTIRLSGTLSSGMLYESVHLPELNVEEARILDSDVTVINESGWNVEIADGDGTIVAGAAFESGTPEVAEARQVFGPIQTQVERPLLLKIDPGDDAARTDQLIDLSRRANHWEYSAITRVSARAGPLRRVRIRLPAELNVAASEIEPTENLISIEEADDGGAKLIFAPDPRSPEEFVFLIRSRIAPPGSGDWTPPSPQVLNSRVGRRYLTLAADSAFSPIASDVNEIVAEEIPDWGRQTARAPNRSEEGGRTFRLTADRVALRRHVAASGSSVDVVLAEGFLWLDEKGAVSAAMDWRFGWSRADAIEIAIPEGAQLRAASLNGHQVPIETAGQRLRVVLPQSSGIGQLTILWDAEARSEGWNGYQQPLPQFLNSDVDTVLLAFLDRRSDSGLHVEHARTLTQAAWLLERFDATLQFAERHVGRAYDVDGPLLTELRMLESTLRRLQSSDPATTSWTGEQETRFGDLLKRRVELGEQIEVSATFPAPAQSTAPADEEAGWRLAVSTLVPGIEETVSEIRFAAIPVASGEMPVLRWTSRPGWLHMHTIGTFALLLVLLAVAVLLTRWERRREFADWIAARPLLGMTALGLIWWLVMQPAVVGLLIVLLAAGLKGADLLRTWRRPLATG
ncbi:hypothetical protein [Maioricimonas rarisocia]|nr:hypothetical protein [Maioricimonas rarisocia]